MVDAAVQDRLRRDAQREPSWHDVRGLTIEGRGFDDAAPFARLPARAEALVRAPVWKLSQHTAGVCCRFRTDARTIWVRWTVTSEQLAMNHMPATGVSGVDLYVRTREGWRWLAVGRPTGKSTTARLVTGLPRAGAREFLLYLPLYNGVASAEVGTPQGRSVTPAPRASPARAPVVFYGTSITQGACASRPGMAHTAILGRRLDREVINLGFSGNGTMDAAIAGLMAEIDAAVYVVDCLPNMRAAEVGKRLGPLIRKLREQRPVTPILIVEDRSYANADLVPAVASRNRASRAALRRAYEALRRAGVGNLHYLRGDGLLGDDGDATVDNSHPSDLGFARLADAFEPVLRRLLPD